MSLQVTYRAERTQESLLTNKQQKRIDRLDLNEKLRFLSEVTRIRLYEDLNKVQSTEVKLGFGRFKETSSLDKMADVWFKTFKTLIAIDPKQYLNLSSEEVKSLGNKCQSSSSRFSCELLIALGNQAENAPGDVSFLLGQLRFQLNKGKHAFQHYATAYARLGDLVNARQMMPGVSPQKDKAGAEILMQSILTTPNLKDKLVRDTNTTTLNYLKIEHLKKIYSLDSPNSGRQILKLIQDKTSDLFHDKFIDCYIETDNLDLAWDVLEKRITFLTITPQLSYFLRIVKKAKNLRQPKYFLKILEKMKNVEIYCAKLCENQQRSVEEKSESKKEFFNESDLKYRFEDSIFRDVLKIYLELRMMDKSKEIQGKIRSLEFKVLAWIDFAEQEKQQGNLENVYEYLKKARKLVSDSLNEINISKKPPYIECDCLLAIADAYLSINADAEIVKEILYQVEIIIIIYPQLKEHLEIIERVAKIRAQVDPKYMSFLLAHNNNISSLELVFALKQFSQHLKVKTANNKASAAATPVD